MLSVVLVNYGGYYRGDERDIRNFYRKVFSEKEIFPFPAPIRRVLAEIVYYSRKREALEIAEYLKGRNLLDISLRQNIEQAKKLEEVLEGKARVKVGFLFSQPFLEEILEELIREGSKEIFILPVFPHYSKPTHGPIERRTKKFKKFFSKIEILPPFYNCELFIKSWIDSIGKALKGLKNPLILFSAHSLPKHLAGQYPEQVKTTVNLIMKFLEEKFKKSFRYKIAYQSKIGKFVPWLEPSTEKVLHEILTKESFKELLIVPISFTTENSETVYEIDWVYYNLVKRHGNIEKFIRAKVPALNNNLLLCWKKLIENYWRC